MSGIENSQKLFTDCKIHLKQALLNILHNEIGDPTVTGIPSDPEELYNYLKGKKKKIEGNSQFKADQKAVLFPSDTETVDSQHFDVTLTRQLIYVFCNIKNAKGKMDKPEDNDTTLWAYVYRATEMRNAIFHKGNIREYDEKTYTDLWKKMKKILDGLKYKGDTRVFLQLLKDYKDYSSENTSEEFHIERRLSVKKNKNEREIIYGDDVSAMGQVLEENNRVLIYGEAGIGKTVASRKIKRDWSKKKILPEYYLLYFKSKTINQQIAYRCNEAPFFFSEMGEGRGKTYENFLLYDCVTRPIENLFILVDGVDGFPINKLLIKDDVDKLEAKVSNNEKITAAETIYAIYYGFLFPNAKICLLGRKGEFQRLKEVEDKRKNSIFNTSDRETADMELLEFNKENIKEFTWFKLRDQKHDCEKIYEKVKDVDLCKVPTDLNSCLELLKEQPNIDIGKITRTKILIAALLNRLNKHIYERINKRCKSFREIRNEEIFHEYLKCIGAMAEISFNALLNGVVIVEGVMEERGYLEDKNHIKVKRTCLEELDLFYIRDDVYYFTLEPYHTLSVEFLTACYLFSHPEKWDSILDLTEDRQLVIIALIAGLLVADLFTNDFVENVLNISDYSLEKFFNWLYGKTYDYTLKSVFDWSDGRFNFLMPNQQLSPPIDLLEYISHEVEIPETLISSTTIVSHCSFKTKFDMKSFNHSFFTKVQDNLDLDSFLDRFPKYKFIIRFSTMKMDDENFNFLVKYKANNRVSIRTRTMYFGERFDSFFDFELSLDEIRMVSFAKSSSITKFLTALSSPSPSIKCRILNIGDITKFNENQIRKLFAICLNGTVESISLSKFHKTRMFTAKQIKILKEMENTHTSKKIVLCLQKLRFRHVLDLPNLGSRNLFLVEIDNVNDDNLRKFRKHVIPGPSSELSKSKVLPSIHGLYQKNDNPQENKTLMLQLSSVDFGNVTSEVFASTFRSIPSLVCEDNYRYIPSAHWKCLSEAKDCQINELRIWFPKSNNYAHFLNIRSKMIQFICGSKDELKELLNHIVRNPNAQLDAKIKVFRVSFYTYDLEKYEEDTLFSRETIKDYKENYILDNSQIDEVQETYYEGEEFNKYWCCEISMPFQKNADLWVIDCCDDNENSSSESSSSDYGSSSEESEDELNDGNCSILKKCCCCFPKL